MPKTWQAYAVDGNGDGVKDVWNPQDAIPSAAAFDCQLLSEVAKVAGDRVRLMLAAYNAGRVSYAAITGCRRTPRPAGTSTAS